jgi:hypothetical protein
MMDVQPTGSQLSKVEADILQTITLGNTVVTLIKEPVTLLYNNIQKKQALKRSLGIWQKEAYEHGELHIPQLCQEKFETYLNQHVGILQATGEYQAGASWGYLLYGLGVHPGMRTIKWRPVLSESIFTQNGGIEMEMDGAVLCHILNLYRTEIDWNSFRSSSYSYQKIEELGQCRLSFGTLAWAENGDHVHARFEPGSLTTLREQKQPFAAVGRRMEPYTHMIAYFNALQHGVSDPSFHLPHHSAPLPDRSRQLVRFFDWLENVQRFHSNSKSLECPTPLLISYEWIAQASRVKRRLLARGGHDQSFYQLICEHIDNHPSMATVGSRTQEKLKDEIFSLFLFGNAAIVHEVLESLHNEPVGTWNHELYLLKKDVIRILFASNIILLDQWTTQHLWILDFTRESALWSQTVLLG